MMWRRPILVAAASTSLLAGCGSPPSVVEPDFFAELRSVDLEQWQIRQAQSEGSVAFATGGPESPLLVGPATFTLANGHTVEVPRDTPGGNLCELLGYRDQPRGVQCLIAGVFSAANRAEWFAVNPVEINEAGEFTLDVDRLEGRDAIVRIGSVFLAVPVRADASLMCSERGDLSATPLDVP